MVEQTIYTGDLKCHHSLWRHCNAKVENGSSFELKRLPPLEKSSGVFVNDLGKWLRYQEYIELFLLFALTWEKLLL